MVVLNVLVELVKLLASVVSPIIEKGTEGVVHHDDAILLQHIIHGKLIILDVGILVCINEEICRRALKLLRGTKAIFSYTLPCIEHDRLLFSDLFGAPTVLSAPQLMFYLLPLAPRIPKSGETYL